MLVSSMRTMRALLVRGGAVWQLVGLITRRSQVQILPPLPLAEASGNSRPGLVEISANSPPFSRTSFTAVERHIVHDQVRAFKAPGGPLHEVSETCPRTNRVTTRFFGDQGVRRPAAAPRRHH